MALISFNDKMDFASLATHSLNLGDEIQRLAADRFLPRIDHILDRERLHEARKLPEIFYLSNGWFAHHPERFPPPLNLKPFYVSFHLASACKLSAEAVAHLISSAPIGCRDQHTLALLRGYKVPSYFSGCLTWTLSRPSRVRNGEVLLVDVPAKLRNKMPPALVQNARRLTHWCGVGATDDYIQMPEMVLHRLRAGVQNALWRMGRFMRARRDISLETEAQVQHWRMEQAETLLALYASAGLVVTSRIHCYFPCLAMGTPVVLVQPNKVFAAERYGFQVPFLTSWTENDIDRIEWRPTPPDLTPARLFLESLCKEAVRIQGNPLQNTPIEHF